VRYNSLEARVSHSGFTPHTTHLPGFTAPHRPTLSTRTNDTSNQLERVFFALEDKNTLPHADAPGADAARVALTGNKPGHGCHCTTPATPMYTGVVAILER